jgi:hypothetical protein
LLLLHAQNFFGPVRHGTSSKGKLKLCWQWRPLLPPATNAGTNFFNGVSPDRCVASRDHNGYAIRGLISGDLNFDRVLVNPSGVERHPAGVADNLVSKLLRWRNRQFV